MPERRSTRRGHALSSCIKSGVNLRRSAFTSARSAAFSSPMAAAMAAPFLCSAAPRRERCWGRRRCSGPEAGDAVSGICNTRDTAVLPCAGRTRRAHEDASMRKHVQERQLHSGGDYVGDYGCGWQERELEEQLQSVRAKRVRRDA